MILDGADWFHWTGINPAFGGELPQICEDACICAKERGVTISCDLNYRGKLWNPDLAQKIMKPLMKYVDVCICNEEDAEKVLGIHVDKTDVNKGMLNDIGFIQTSEKINRLYGCKYIATTLRKSCSASRNGWRAILYNADIQQSYVSTEYDIQIIDRVGGGDSFSAGLIYAHTADMNSQDAIDFATAASCLKQTMEGDFNRSTVSEIESLVKNGGSGRVQR